MSVFTRENIWDNQVKCAGIGRLGLPASLALHRSIASARSACRHANPKIIEPEAASPADAAAAAAASAMRLWDTGVRFWRLWRRSESHYTVIRRLHNLPVSGAARFTKQAIDLDTEEERACHPALDTVMTVTGAEEVVFVDIAVQCGLYLEVLLPAVLGAPERWVRVVLLEGNVALMPKGISYRLSMPSKGIVGLIRARMPPR